MKRSLLISLVICAAMLSMSAIGRAQALPAPQHIVVVFLENHAYSQIMGCRYAPHLNALAADAHTALFTDCHALTHPSQPNYLYFFSGSNQGCTDDDIPLGTPFKTPNLAAELIAAGKTFATYSEGLPSVGFNGARNGSYARKHNPAANWQGSDSNQLPPTVNQPLTALPGPTGYAALPTVSFIVPMLNHDMHNNPYPDNIAVADDWIYQHLDSLRQWALTNNTLLIITFDEDDDLHDNRIFTLFYGPMVKGGRYTGRIDHINILRTIEDMYHLTHAGKAAASVPIMDCWN